MRDTRRHPDTVDAAEHEAEQRTRGPWRWVLYGLALVLLAGCIYLAIGAPVEEDAPSGWERLAGAAPADVAAMLGLVIASVAINGWIFWVMVKPFETGRPVGLGDMTALIGATALLNYLPMRAGLIGRAAYLKQRHDVDYRTSVVMMAMVAAGTMYVFALVVAVTLWRGGLDAAWWAASVGGLAAAAVVALPLTRLGLRWAPGFGTVPTAWLQTAGLAGAIGAFGLLAARLLDVICLAGRLWLAARIFGTPIELPAAVVMATGGMFITLATPLPNGLGLREGVYGLFAAAGLGGEAMPTGRLGLSVGLIDRAAEAIIFILGGLIALAYLHRRSVKT